MKVCMDEFRSLAARYGDLHQASFDADYATLRNVELYPSVCSQQPCFNCYIVFSVPVIPSQL